MLGTQDVLVAVAEKFKTKVHTRTHKGHEWYSTPRLSTPWGLNACAAVGLCMQIFVEDEKLRESFKCVPELKRAKIFAADPLESRFHLLKNQRYTNRTEVLLEPDALYIRPVRIPPPSSPTAVTANRIALRLI
jgi:hypothetical protein